MKTVNKWRYFLAHQDHKLEAWLEAEARQGRHLARPGVFRHTFTTGAPSPSKYRIDFQLLRGAARKEYITLFEDAGWEFAGQVANRYYFKAGPHAASPEIFSDADSRRDRIRRQMRVMAAIAGLLVLQMSIGVSRFLESFTADASNAGSNVPLMTILLAGAFAMLAAWMLWQMEQAYKREA